MLEMKNQTMSLYESMEAEKVTFGQKEKEYEDHLNKMGIELEAESASELRLMDDNEALKVWGDKAYQRAVAEKKMADDEHVRAQDERARAEEAGKRADEAIKRMEEAEARMIKAVELWRASPEFDALAHDAYVVALKKLVKHIHPERPEFDVDFLEESLGEQKKELQKLPEAVGV